VARGRTADSSPIKPEETVDIRHCGLGDGTEAIENTPLIWKLRWWFEAMGPNNSSHVWGPGIDALSPEGPFATQELAGSRRILSLPTVGRTGGGGRKSPGRRVTRGLRLAHRRLFYHHSGEFRWRKAGAVGRSGMPRGRFATLCWRPRPPFERGAQHDGARDRLHRSGY